MAGDVTLKLLEEHDLGLTWVADDWMERGAHALVADGRVWYVDPFPAPGAYERASQLGEPAGVIQLLDRHDRDCAGLARRLRVAHLRMPDTLDDSPFEVLRVVDRPGWREQALWWPERRALVVAEAIGTAGYFALGRSAGSHPMLRGLPPSTFADLEPEHLLVGHGPPLHGADAVAAPALALGRARRDAWRVPLALVKARS